MIQAESDTQKREEYLQRLMALPNQVCLGDELIGNVFHTPSDAQTELWWLLMAMWCYVLMQKWGEILAQAHQSVDFLKDQDVIRTVLNILQV